MRERISPCKECKNRRSMCHAMCIEYSKWSDEHNEHMKERAKKRDLEKALVENIMRKKDFLRSHGYLEGKK